MTSTNNEAPAGTGALAGFYELRPATSYDKREGVASSRYKFAWTCDACKQPVADGDGWVSVDLARAFD